MAKPSEWTYANVGWTVGDILTLFDMSEEKAHEFMEENQGHFRDRIIELGWQVWSELGSYDGLQPKKDVYEV